MRLSNAGELALLETLRKRFTKETSGLVIGIGDDCAVVRPKGRNVLLTTDMMVEGVHFDLGWTTPYQLGFKLISVNVSDIYAMGGEPEFFLLNFAAGGNLAIGFFQRFFDGIRDAAQRYKIFLVGGDISSSDKVILSATLTGHASKVIRRNSAKVGDRIYVSGMLGDSACGLNIMKKIYKPIEIERKKKARHKLGWDIISPLIRRHLMPEAVRPDRFVNKATAMIDISDGLLIDLSRLCRESKAGARIYTESIPISDELREVSAYLKLDPLELAMAGGEDYELLFTAREDVKVDAFCIGEITSSGIRVIDEKGKRRKSRLKGYQHFEV